MSRKRIVECKHLNAVQITDSIFKDLKLVLLQTNEIEYEGRYNCPENGRYPIDFSQMPTGF